MVHTLTILHVDDDPDVLSLSRTSFQQSLDRDVEVVTARSAEEGLEALRSDTFDCVISDSVRLENGTPFVVAARREDATTPILFFTAKAWGDVAEAAIEGEVAGYVQKADSDDVEQVVKRTSALAERGSAIGLHERPSDESQPSAVANDGGDSGGEVDAGLNGDWRAIGRHDWDEDDELGTTIARSLQTLTGVDTLSAEPLFPTLDADALESLLSPTSGQKNRYGVNVRFQYQKWEVAVTHAGEVLVRDLPKTGYE
jgi:CheY-like chemotaxis protein